MRKIKGIDQFFTSTCSLLRCCLAVIVVRSIGHTTAATNYTVTAVTPEMLSGASPVWISKTRSMYFADAGKCTIHRYQPGTGEFVGVRIDGHDILQFLVPVSGESMPTFVVDNYVTLGVVTWNGKDIDPIKVAYDLNLSIDTQYEYLACGKSDSRGRLWIGVSKVSNGDPRRGKLCMINQNGVANIMLDNIFAPDAITWSPLSTRIYWLNIDTRKIYRRMFNTANGKMSRDDEVVVDFGAKNLFGNPCDMTMDTDGNLWVACMDASRVLKIDPRSGTTLLQIDFPGVDSITNVVFGGENLKDLYVTGMKTSMFCVTNTGSTGLVAHAVILPPP